MRKKDWAALAILIAIFTLAHFDLLPRSTEHAKQIWERLTCR